MKTPLLRLLLLINGGLLALILAVWLLGSTHWQAPPPSVPDASAFGATDIASKGVEYEPSVIFERPLFRPERRPFPAEPSASEQDAEAAKAAAEAEAARDEIMDSARLTGVAGGGRTGAVIVEQGGASHRITVGGKLGGWQLDAIEPFAAVFSRSDGREHRLEISRDAAAPKAPPEQANRRNPRRPTSIR